MYFYPWLCCWCGNLQNNHKGLNPQNGNSPLLFQLKKFHRTAIIGKISIDTIHPEDIFIGKGTAIADGCILLSHYYDVYNLKEHAYYRGQIHIGRNVYIASNTIFTKPVTIGDGAIIGAGSIVNKDIPPYTVWGGAPARFICNRYKEELEIPVNTELFKPR